MSLKGFHIVFIVLAVMVTLLFAWWVLATPMGQASGAVVRWSGLGSGVLGLALAVYGVWFVKNKSKKIII